jgi:hypothetical protein
VPRTVLAAVMLIGLVVQVRTSMDFAQWVRVCNAEGPLSTDFTSEVYRRHPPPGKGACESEASERQTLAALERECPDYLPLTAVPCTIARTIMRCVT